jgi:hypothetical protein
MIHGGTSALFFPLPVEPEYGKVIVEILLVVCPSSDGYWENVALHIKNAINPGRTNRDTSSYFGMGF